ncbi:1,5-anhydro-D-fructose reductase [Portunus trituberculatus]|uniref:1,5-anhydro-D-fructose reductase n=1 Tax=Portunus trituberculatus TaxID=210409 RepID=A0A5B7DC36_PORTR|nr:1,5-anhydro-D-fructose reductase [Portunus trituberculatus]
MSQSTENSTHQSSQELSASDTVQGTFSRKMGHSRVQDLHQEEWAVHNLGLRHFSQEQVENLLKGGVRYRPLALQAEINPYREQRDLRCWCQEANISLVAIHPYGSPLHVPSKDMPFLWKHPKVIKIAERVGVGPKVILSRHILQSRLRMVYDNTELFLPSFMTENIWRFQLTHGQMNKLGKLSKLSLKHPLGKYELQRVIDPCWPFFFPEERIRGDVHGGGMERNCKEDEEAERKNIEEINQAKDSGVMINKEVKEEWHEEKKRKKAMDREIEMRQVYGEESIVEREEEEGIDKEEREEEEENTGEEVDEEEEGSEVEDVEEMEEEERISEMEESEVEEEEEMNEEVDEEGDEEENQNEEEEELEEEKEEITLTCVKCHSGSDLKHFSFCKVTLNPRLSHLSPAKTMIFMVAALGLSNMILVLVQGSMSRVSQRTLELISLTSSTATATAPAVNAMPLAAFTE